jgi:hypothetical protein
MRTLNGYLKNYLINPCLPACPAYPTCEMKMSLIFSSQRKTMEKKDVDDILSKALDGAHGSGSPDLKDFIDTREERKEEREVAQQEKIQEAQEGTAKMGQITDDDIKKFNTICEKKRRSITEQLAELGLEDNFSNRLMLFDRATSFLKTDMEAADQIVLRGIAVRLLLAEHAAERLSQLESLTFQDQETGEVKLHGVAMQLEKLHKAVETTIHKEGWTTTAKVKLAAKIRGAMSPKERQKALDIVLGSAEPGEGETNESTTSDSEDQD